MSAGCGDWPYSELAKFEVVALGCHRKLQEKLARFFRSDHGIEAFQLVEYFLREPVRRSGDEPSMICFPFLRRLLEQNVFQLRGKDGGFEIRPLTSEVREEVELEEIEGTYHPRRYVLPFQESIIGQTTFDTWSGTPLQDIPRAAWFERYSAARWEEYERRMLQAPDKFRDIYLVEFNLAARFWKACADGIATIVGGYPICSEDMFYGYFVLVWPEPSINSFDSEPPHRKEVEYDDVVSYLDEQARESYVPTLALLHNSICEDRFCSEMKDHSDAATLRERIDALPASRWSREAKDLIERGLASLWQKRKELLLQPDGMARVKATLLFRKYNIASPGMVQQIRNIIQRAPHFYQPGPGAKLPAALVYGEAGSGKDTMAKVIQLFTAPSWSPREHTSNCEEQSGYFGLRLNTINMSSLKPDALFGPLFQGMRISDPHLDVAGILTRDGKGDDSDASSPDVFILDELNSLNVDLQGVLLRVLENGEVTPLFDIKPFPIKHLMIGIVNEDPDVLMRESETRILKDMKGFTGELINNALYEFFVRGRRLRPDLFYRLSRSLYVKLPALRERRDDIPILFHFECEDAVKQELKHACLDQGTEEHEVYIELKAYESLMQTSLDWPGNIRQLQAVATEAAIDSVKQYLEKGHNARPGIVYVWNETVEGVLRKYFPKVFETSVGDTYTERKNHGRSC